MYLLVVCLGHGSYMMVSGLFLSDLMMQNKPDMLKIRMSAKEDVHGNNNNTLERDEVDGSCKHFILNLIFL